MVQFLFVFSVVLFCIRPAGSLETLAANCVFHKEFPLPPAPHGKRLSARLRDFQSSFIREADRLFFSVSSWPRDSPTFCCWDY